MTDDASQTLFHPFVSGMIDMPDAAARVLVLGASAGFRAPAEFAGEFHAAQGFRPDFLALQRRGFKVSPSPEGEGYDLALVLLGRHRGENEARLGTALKRVRPGGLVVVTGSKREGADSLRKRVDKLLPLAGSAAKYHALAFWLVRPDDAALDASGLSDDTPTTRVEGRFVTAPGMFSRERVDPGSKLLADHLPDDLSGAVADFCAGWGYLAARAAERESVTALDLYEADFAALEAARTNLAAIRPALAKEFFWVDLVGEKVERGYDAIVMNPPFHQGRAAEPEIGRAMIRAASGALKRGGRLFMVANTGLPYEAELATGFAAHGELAREGGFKLLWARR